MRPQGSNLLGTNIKSAPAIIIWARGTLNFATPRALSGYVISSCSSCFSIGFLPVPLRNTRKQAHNKFHICFCGMMNSMREKQNGDGKAYKDYYLNILFDKLGNGCYKNIWTFLLFKSTNEAYDRDVSIHWQSNFCLESFLQKRLCIRHLWMPNLRHIGKWSRHAKQWLLWTRVN